MSTQASLFAAYFGIGVVLTILALISSRASRGTKMPEPVDDGPIAAVLCIFIVLLWPLWLVRLLFAKDDEPPRR